MWDSVPMRAALARVDLPAVLALLRSSAGLTQSELAELVPGWTQCMVARMESGARGTLFDIRSLLAFADAIDMPRVALLPLVLGDPDATQNTTPPRFKESDVDRRTFTGRAAAATAGLIVPGWLAASAFPERVTTAHLHYLRVSGEVLEAREQAVGGVTLVDEAIALYRRARAMLDNSEYTESIGNQLLVLSGDLGVRAGFAAYDAGRQKTARQLFVESTLLAETAGDPVLSVHTNATTALQSTYLSRRTESPGSAREALRLLDRAAHVARREPSARLHALLEMRRAPATALLGDEAGARKAIAKAREVLDQRQDEGDPSWMAFITQDEISGHEASTLLHLGKPEKALDLYQGIIASPSLSPRNRTCYQAALASTLFACGDKSNALPEALRTLSAVEGGITTRRAVERLRPLRKGIDDEEFSARFDALTKDVVAT